MNLKSRSGRNALLAFSASFVCMALFNNCQGRFTTQEMALTSLSSQGSLASCGDSLNASPATIDEAVELINQLPKPLSIPCFVSHLKKPLQVYATNNVFSAQPAQGSDNPRIFIFSGNLSMSIVPMGPGRNVIEFGQMVSSAASIKGEIPFPVTDTTLTASLPYSRIVETTGRTTCIFCHSSESRALNVTTGEAYSSNILRPDPFTRVNQNHMLSTTQACDPNQDPLRCQILRSVYVDGQAQDRDFPTDLQ